MASAKSDVTAMIGELNWIIRELSDISSKMKSEFQGIGTEKCAASIESVISNCKTVKKKLSNMDTVTVTDSFAAAQGRHG